MANQNFIIDTTLRSNDLTMIETLNQNASLPQAGIPRSQMLLTTLTTTMMMALDSPLPTEYYQHTRAYLESIRSEQGTSLPNISAFLAFIDKFEEKHNIQDDMQHTRIELPADEVIEISDDDAHVSFGEKILADETIGGEPIFNSTEANQENMQKDEENLEKINDREKHQRNDSSILDDDNEN